MSTHRFKDHDKAYDFIHNITTSDLADLIDTTEEGLHTVTATYPGGKHQLQASVFEVDIETGSCVDANGSTYPTYGKTALEVEIVGYTFTEDESQLKPLFDGFAKIFGVAV